MYNGNADLQELFKDEAQRILPRFNRYALNGSLN